VLSEQLSHFDVCAVRTVKPFWCVCCQNS